MQPVTIYPDHSVLPLGNNLPDFEHTILKNKVKIKRQKNIQIFQVNIGKKCDLACHHCHVEAGPKRTENMDAPTADRLLELLSNSPTITTVDLTGGAPELNPHFRRVVTTARQLGKTVYDRCNLTVLFEAGQEYTAQFLADNGVTIIASLPCYQPENVDQQRGKGTFDKSIKALQILNQLGYGIDGSGLELNLVYNPVGTHLPPAQEQLQADYKQRLGDSLGIHFNQLFTITNMPIKRYVHYLKRENLFDDYMTLLVNNFNIAAAANVMCTNMLSISWDGKIYDCDFNQMLDIPINNKQLTIWDIDNVNQLPSGIAFDNHCYGCTAGAGSSCGGALTE